MTNKSNEDSIRIENNEWRDSLDYLYKSQGAERVKEMFRLLQRRAQQWGVSCPYGANTPYLNTIPVKLQSRFPGKRDLERRIKSLIRWNAMAMVVRANRESDGIGGHISTFASAATLWEVGFNHFFNGQDSEHGGDMIFFQGHASPGLYARAFLEGRLSVKDLENFRRELRPEGGLSSYPHPRLMPDFWEFPTVSMGLAPIMAIYQARFNRYMEDQGLIEKSARKVWAFLGDGEMDEPESMGAITLASRESLDNLIFVINCNLQRLDGPVRGNGNIIQELEAAFRGAGWNVIKVIWGSDWDRLLESDSSDLLQKRFEEAVDGDFQKYSVSDGAYIREHFFGKYPELESLVENYSDDELRNLRLGGHDPEKVYAAYLKAVEQKGSPTVILARTIKGYGLGEAGEGKNITHQQKKMNEEELKLFRTRFNIPISDEDVSKAPFYRPDETSPEIQYLKNQRKKLGGFLPGGKKRSTELKMPPDHIFSEFFKGSGKKEFATTMVTVHLLSKLLKDQNLGKHIVPIVPDEARTFGMETLFRKFGIYSHDGQNYEPVDKDSLIFYNEAENGMILEEGITEAGSMSSFIAAGTSDSAHGIPMIPFFFFYSMFGFQRIGDLIWAAGDAMARGFMMGGTSGRTTLPGEGLQHQDGNSHLTAFTYPAIRSYDPAFAYEIAVIVREGIREMFVQGKPVIYYLTIMNEFYPMPVMPENIEEGILNGIYGYKTSSFKSKKIKAHLLGSGTILRESLKAQEFLESKLDIPTNVYSVTSYRELYRDGVETDRSNRLNPGSRNKKSFLETTFKDLDGVFVSASDYVKAVPLSVSKWIPGPLTALGTDGFGRSDSRSDLRDYFEISARYIAAATVHSLYRHRHIRKSKHESALQKLGIPEQKPNPMSVEMEGEESNG
jgi:pyruvate dehydrogenase E1 component